MNYVALPLFDEPFYTFSISLEGDSYNLEFVYNERSSKYFINLYDADNIPLVLGEALVPSHRIMENYPLLNLTGFFWLEEKSDRTSEPYKQYPDKLNQYYNFYYIYE